MTAVDGLCFRKHMLNTHTSLDSQRGGRSTTLICLKYISLEPTGRWLADGWILRRSTLPFEVLQSDIVFAFSPRKSCKSDRRNPYGYVSKTKKTGGPEVLVLGCSMLGT